MPYIIRPRGIRNVVATLLGSAMLLGAAPAVSSAAECTSSTGGPVSKLLSQFGDNALYSLLSGSSFEAGAPGWSLQNASVVSGGPAGSSKSLQINWGGSAVSPAVCVTEEEPTFRFFARRVSGYSPLSVSLHWTEHGFPHSVNVGSINSGGSWTLSPALELATALEISESSDKVKVNIAFEPGFGSTWAIDDVYIDPYSR